VGGEWKASSRRPTGDLRVDLQVVTIPFEALVDRLAAREVDMVASNLSITPERALQVAFTEPYGVSAIRAVTRTYLLEPDATPDLLNAEILAIATTAGTTRARRPRRTSSHWRKSPRSRPTTRRAKRCSPARRWR
jgi:ABC-type amino acid transport substrate-binding protein